MLLELEAHFSPGLQWLTRMEGGKALGEIVKGKGTHVDIRANYDTAC